MTPLPPITIEEIEKALDMADVGMFAMALNLFERLRDHLVSGEYALVSKADREQGLQRAMHSGWNRGKADFALELDPAPIRSIAVHDLAQARELLKIDPPTRTETP